LCFHFKLNLLFCWIEVWLYLTLRNQNETQQR
jgi:hypothetical protein